MLESVRPHHATILDYMRYMSHQMFFKYVCHQYIPVPFFPRFSCSCEALFAHCGSPAATNSTCAQEVLKVHSCRVAASAGRRTRSMPELNLKRKGTKSHGFCHLKRNSENWHKKSESWSNLINIVHNFFTICSLCLFTNCSLCQCPLFPKVLPSDSSSARTSEAIAVSAFRGRRWEALRTDTADVAILCGTHSRGPDLADLEHLKFKMI